MVDLADVIESNRRIASTFPSGLVAVFVGGTSGVGEYTLKAFARYAPNSRVYIVGRSQESADHIIQECEQLSPNSKFAFIQADVSLLKNVDDVCRQIKAKERVINVLVETQGSMAFEKITSEGLPVGFALVAHSRLRFILNLLPLLQNAGPLSRVVSVMAASYEGPIDTNNIAALGLGLHERRDQLASVETLLLEEAARRAPNVGFVHSVPGVVKSGITREMKGSLGMTVMLGITRLLEPLINTTPAECGERTLFLATSARFPPHGRGAGDLPGVPLSGKTAIAKGSDGQTGSGVYSVDNKGESSPAKVEALLARFRQDGTSGKVVGYVMADLKKITGTDAVV